MPTVKLAPRAQRDYDDLRAAAERAEANRQKKGKKKKSQQEGLFGQVAKALSFLAANLRHPSLQTHQFQSLPNPIKAGEKVFVAYSQQHTPGAYRIFFCYGPGKDEIYVIAITPHP